MQYDADGEYIDEWYDDREGEQWVISSAKMDSNNLYWDDAAIWFDDDDMSEQMEDAKTIPAVIKTEKGRDVNRKCMHMMGGRLCFCQFMQWIDSPKYHCHPQQSMFAGFSEPNEDKKVDKAVHVAAAAAADDDDDDELDNYYEAMYVDDEWDAASYFGQNDEDNEDEFAYFDNRWVRHKDEPSEMIKREHPQQQKYWDHNLFIYNDYDDDIEYKQKKYVHAREKEEDGEGDDESDDEVGFDAMIEINSHLFWLLSLFAVFFGILLCSALSYYLQKREEFMLEFVRQFGPGIISKGKYGFTPINVPLTHSDSDEESADECLSNQLI